MQLSYPIETDIVLLGAGHAHVEVLRRFAMHPDPGIRLTLIGREPETPYSGMLPGLIRGDYAHHQAHIDLAPLAAAARARLILAEATAIKLDSQSVIVPGRPAVDFDLLSIDVGGVPKVPAGAGIGVKPIGQFLNHLQRLEAELPGRARIAVVGGGAAGTELSLALAVRFGRRVHLTLVCAAADPVPSAPAAARRAVRQVLTEARVELICGVTAVGLNANRLELSDGSFLEVATALWATGVEGPPFLAASGLACDDSGCIRVQPTLRSVSHACVFAAGDCATFEANERPKSGVWAVRAGAPLAQNLRHAAHQHRLLRWTPQRDALVLLGVGHGKAIGWRNGLTIRGQSVWWLKDRIDRRWMRMYTKMRMKHHSDEAMRCGGCGAKVGAEVLAGALAGLNRTGNPDLLHSPDDAAVLRPPSGKLLVQSVDHFRAFLDDPFLFGQIAAAHALSDLHAMGASPWTALAMAAIPFASKQKMRADLAAMLEGATEVLQGDGCALIGGHSAEATEAALGFAVTGVVDEARMLRKGGLRPRDRLILTKPLGTGIILAAHMRGQARAQWLLAAIASMRATNGVAARIALAYGPTAGTDVTGFGLAGHLDEMLQASASAAVIWPDEIPALPGARALAEHGVESTLASDNRRVIAELDPLVTALLTDPQTSGGLLLGIPHNRADDCLKSLRDHGVDAAIIGVVEDLQRGARSIRLE